MPASDQRRPPLPRDPLELRQEAEAALDLDNTEAAGAEYAIALALLAVAGELAAIRRDMRKR
ncbi:hypothetical protein [Streptomyces sp.]|uniref:hypothetical protein n=1 Tax=Streptomyces sp. TaxID=1931 RepID=UPI002F40B48C